MSEEKYKYQIRATTKFKKAIKLATKRGKDTDKLKNIVEKLAKGEPLDAALRDHSLSGNWSNHRELHIEPDWLLIYRIEKDILLLELVDTGSHADLFK
ncbi:type II toxin-antitoxin system YafQ family toxin [uncultured Fibrobacter sp.]|uniref:type II toxin-antitoxin system YafQ family toxin n=1 Tax=uncultured Fibrobacter sp. TaxID=261512 RepID=UPI0028042DE5|nr:type II toxin-antitoxin system YafQ family toxin [uncultured Fibrobacter sp.]